MELGPHKSRSRIIIRPIQGHHIPEIESHYNRIFADYLQRYIPLMRAEPGIYGKDYRHLCYSAFDGPKIVSHAAARLRPLTIDGAKINWASFGNVFTLLTYREKGIATRLNRALWGKLKKMGTDGVFISGGRGLYRRHGATHCGNYRGFTCQAHRVQSSLLPKHGLAIRPCGPADAPRLIEFHRHERTGFQRTHADFMPILKERLGNLRSATAWLVSHRGSPMAYLAISRWPRRHGELIDYAGTRSAIALALPAIMKEMNLNKIDLVVPASDAECLHLARSLCQEAESWKGVDGTQLLLDPMRLIRRLRPYFEACLGNRTAGRLKLSRNPAGGFVWRFGSRFLRHQDIHVLTRFILGDLPGRWVDLLPHDPAFRAVLRGVFPIPFPVIGLNWL